MARPTKKDDETIRKLEEAFKIDATVDEACVYAGIGTSTYHDWMRDDESFRSKMQSAQQFVFMHAKRNWVEAIVTKKDVDQSVNFLKRRAKRLYSDSILVGGDTDNPLQLSIKQILSDLDGKTKGLRGNQDEASGSGLADQEPLPDNS